MKTVDLMMETNRDQSLFSFKNYPYLKWLILIVGVFIILPTNLVKLDIDYIGVDPAWKLALNMAIKEGFIFGQDFSFTYGPLGYLQTGLHLYVSKFGILLFNIFLLTNIAYTLHNILELVQKKYQIIILCLIIILMCGNLSEQRVYLLALIFYFNIFQHLKEKKKLALLFASGVAIYSFFIKLNTAIILNALLFIYLFYQFFDKEGRTFYATFLVGHLIALVSFSWYLNVDIPNYLVDSMHFIDAYNDAMFSASRNAIYWYSIIIAIAFTCSGLTLLYYRPYEKEEFLKFFFIAVGLYILYKSTHVRGGLGKILVAVDYSVFYFFCLQLYVKDIDVKRILSILLIPIICLSFYATKTNFNKTIRSWDVPFSDISRLFSDDQTIKDQLIQKRNISIIKRKKALQLVKNDKPEAAFKYLNKHNLLNHGLKLLYSRKIKNSNYSKKQLKKNLTSFLQLYTEDIPLNFIDLIGNKTVDIVWSRIDLLFYNDLNYLPRPVIQSYAAYDKHLDNRNAIKYASNDAPEFIIYQHGTIDRRHPFWDEAQTKLTLLKHYEIIKKENGFLLLKKRSSPLNENKKTVDKYISTWDEHIIIKTSKNIQYITVEMEYSFLGKLRRLLYEPNFIETNIEYEDGSKSHHRAIIPILKGGVLANKKAIDTNDAFTFFNTKGKKNKKTTKLSFHNKESSIWMKDEIKITLTDYQFK